MAPHMRLQHVMALGIWFFRESAIVLRQFGNNCSIACGLLSQAYQYLRPQWQVHVNTRTEFDKAQMFVNVALVIFVGITHNSSGHGTRHLSDEDVMSFRRFNDDSGTFIFQTGFGKPSLMEVTIFMLDRLDMAVNRKPVGMDIKQRHENGNHNPFVMEILVFLYFLKYYYLSVGWSNDQSFSVSVEEADGTPKEVDHNGIDNDCQSQNGIEDMSGSE